MLKSIRLPHPIILLLGAVIIAALFTWVLPAGEYNRQTDGATGRQVVVPGTYHAVEDAPVGPFRTAVALPRGFIEAADVIIAVLLAGGAFVLLDQVGVLTRAVGALTGRLKSRGLWAIPIVSLFFYCMGGLENMQEEIIPLIPVLLVLARGIGVDALTAVAMSAGAAMAGSAFSPVNPFQASIALKLAELPPSDGAGLRTGMFVVAFVVWVVFTMRYASRHRMPVEAVAPDDAGTFSLRDGAMLVAVLSPILIYLYGALKFEWGFNELSAGFLIGGIAAGAIGGLSAARATTLFLNGMGALLPAALLIGVARSISVVLTDGHVIDTILHSLATPLGNAPPSVAALLMIPFHMLVHVAVPSVSGHAVLTMPVLVPLSDLLGLSRQVTVLAYQAGAGLTDLLIPTNGALMAMLLAAGVTFQQWLRVAIVGWALMMAIGVAGILLVIFTS
ncbi:MAG: YfcC family protein [Phycisphaerae bacterium]|nr:YfcC family protein [Gemmatimonadaceae bacterium]